MNELEVAKAIAEGVLPSPTQFLNAAFYALRISGTGAAWRESRHEFVWREPSIWLCPAMEDRARGLPVIWQHPKEAVLGTDSFRKTIVGTIMFAWVKGSELWGIARILDDEAAALIESGELDTSPAVLFAQGTGATIPLEDGNLLVEGEPMLLDHLAICAAGVWSKGREDNSGVEVTQPQQENV